MNRDAGDAVVRQIRPEGQFVSVTPIQAEQPIVGLLSDDVTVVRDWPHRTALILGGLPSGHLREALDRYGLTTVSATRDQSGHVASAGPFSFIIIPSRALGDDASVEWIMRVHRMSPSARLLLAHERANRDVDVLIRALRAGIHDVFDPADPVDTDAAIKGGLRTASRHHERVLAIGAHPDDVEIGCGGTLLDHRRRGDRLSILTMSRGAVGGDHRERVHEAATVAEALGAQLLLGDLPDTRIDDGVATIRLIEDVVRAVDPTVIYVHSRHDNHQDHRAVATATASASRGVRRVFAYQSPSATDEFRPTKFVAIDGVLQLKVQLLLMFGSQNGRSYLEPELVVAGSRYWARHLTASARYAEPFEVIRSVGDLRQSETTPALFTDLEESRGVDVDLAPPRIAVHASQT